MKLRFLGVAAAALIVAAGVPVRAADAPVQLPEAVVAAAKSLQPRHGKIAIAEAHATLDLGDAYDFYGPEDARKILVDIWGNPSQSADRVLGMVMPAGASPLSDAWGAVVTYEETGFVSDDDAGKVDYAELLTQMREGEDENNEKRKAEGYPAMHLAGWAEQPTYDAGTHSVVWAQDIAVGDAASHTLNYDVRTLGRRGVLSLNLVSSMDQLSDVRQAATAFADHAAFDQGARYQDYDSSTDKTAEYGIGGLIAAGVGVAAAKKLGILAILLKFLKPIAIAAIAAFAVLRNKIAGLFGRRKAEEDDPSFEEQQPVAAPAEEASQDGAEDGADEAASGAPERAETPVA
ncbi:DUF2167 domain-containing protein [Sphingomonas sp. IC081]|uniref:DUF2167 domain-containing protein n=1 Tax=Sphingomonas sp. IC081 TaxID=304378 RepID=UPI001157CAB3|nr:DUF2167 domain-containing protein [Sphingomonas sp. IC081]QDK32466.1 DUF2167 domain-containing protein [Sphingomonas sp. IC081]